MAASTHQQNSDRLPRNGASNTLAQALTITNQNCLAEKYVQIAKNILKNAKQENQDPYQGLLSYQNTPIDDSGSPAQLLMGRCLHKKLPTIASQLMSKVQNPKMVTAAMAAKQMRQKDYYNQGAKPLKPLQKGT